MHGSAAYSLEGLKRGVPFSPLISAISPKGHMKFMIIGGKLSARQFCDFLRRLIYRTAHPIFFIVDGHPVHRATAIKRFLAKEKKRLKLFFLPPYSPELNPDELVWNDLKNNGIGRMTVSGPQDLKQKSISHMRTLQRDTQKIQSFFQAPTTKYAALNV